MKNSDSLFLEKEISARAYTAELSVCEKDRIEKKEGASALVLPMTFGNLYTVRAEEKCTVRAAVCDDTEALSCVSAESVPFDAAEDFIYTPLSEGLSLVVSAEKPSALRFFETPILLGRDTVDEWFYPEVGLHLEKGKEGCFGDVDWTAEELLENVYEPLMKKYPDYISRECIGRDESGKYEMYAYTFAPREYEKTLFITSGIHGTEFIGTLAFARFIELMCESDGSHEGLNYLRNRTRLIVIPIVNVWSRGENKCRENVNGVDLNRDFDAFTQAESRNIASLISRHKDKISAVLDLHTAGPKNPGLWYQFNPQAKNAAASFKCINHVAQLVLSRGYEKEIDLSKIPGKYIKRNVFLQGYVYNELSLPNIVIEHNIGRWYEKHSAEAFAYAIECYGNFIIQTALADI